MLAPFVAAPFLSIAENDVVIQVGSGGPCATDPSVSMGNLLQKEADITIDLGSSILENSIVDPLLHLRSGFYAGYAIDDWRVYRRSDWST